MKTTILPLILIPLCWGLAAQFVQAGETADAIYHGGPIVTMIRDGHRVDALAVRGGMIIMTGDKADVMGLQGEETKLIDLAGRCLMPGFIDPHSHVALQSAKFSTVNLDPHPIGDVRTIADIQRKLREHIEKVKPEAGKWVIGWGYDDTGLQEMRHPNRDDLDAVSTEHPILLVHISSHFAAINSKALEVAGIDADTPDPDGGVIQRRPGTSEPNGVLEETAWMALAFSIPPPSREKMVSMLETGLEFYAAAGITTAQDGASSPGIAEVFQGMSATGKVPIDVVVYPLFKASDQEAVEQISKTWKEMTRVRLGGIKLVLDGSIQGYTAFLSKPYYVQPDGTKTRQCSCDSPAADRMFFGAGSSSAAGHDHDAGKEASCGYASMTLEEVTHWIETCDKAGIPVLAHCNGDAATDLLIEAIKIVRKGWPRPDLRTVIIHAQTMRDDQLNFAANHGLVPSFFPIHVVFWGDRHREMFLGPERAARIDPARSALDRGMKFTLHHDAPIAGISMLEVAEAAVTRITSSGKLLGPEERITAYQALRAVTKDAAWQYFEEHRKGTLEPGKLADLVILDADPLAVDPTKISEIEVLETIKEGRSVFRADQN